MTAPDDTGGLPAGPVRRHGRTALVIAGVAVAAVGLAAVVTGRSQAGSEDPLGPDAAGLSDVSMRTVGACRYVPDRGGLVAGFAVTSAGAGRFVLDVEAATREGIDDLDLPASPHVVRYTVPFYGGRTTKRFEVVVPLTRAEHRDGYRECRWYVNGRP